MRTLHEKVLVKMNQNPFLIKIAREHANKKTGKVFVMVREREHSDWDFQCWSKSEKLVKKKLDQLKSIRYYSDNDPLDATLISCGDGLEIVKLHVDELKQLDDLELWTSWAESNWYKFDEWTRQCYVESIKLDGATDEVVETVKKIFKI